VAPPVPKDSRPADVGSLVDEAMTAALAGETRDDSTFGEYATVFGFCRSAVMQGAAARGFDRAGRPTPSRPHAALSEADADRSGGAGDAEAHTLGRDQGHPVS
jgi:hypothetical protein